MTPARRTVMLLETIAAFVMNAVVLKRVLPEFWNARIASSAFLLSGMTFLGMNFIEDLSEIVLLDGTKLRPGSGMHVLQVSADMGLILLGLSAFGCLFRLQSSMKVKLFMGIEITAGHFMLRILTGQIRMIRRKKNRKKRGTADFNKGSDKYY